MSSSRYVLNNEGFEKLTASLLYISTSKYENDWQSIPHIHHFSELIYITEGRGFFTLEDKKYQVGEGDLIIIPPDMEHTEHSFDCYPLEYIAVGVSGIAFRDNKSLERFFICHYGADTELLSVLLLLLNEAEGQKAGYSTACQALLDVLLIRLVRKQELMPSGFTPSRMTKECSQIKRYLDSNYADSITLDQLASLTHMSKYYLVHAFTRYSGLSPINYLNARRIEISKELLVTTDHSIAQIASLTGFSSQSYFAQVFKRESGKTPAQYRKEFSYKNT